MKKASINFTFLYKKYPGQWVALANDEKTVLAVGKTAKEVLNTTKTNKKDTPILYRVPSKISFSINLSAN
ncbi:MAG: DUF5678 domain-containing protein [Patescibacteria group bacterium]